MTVPVLKVTSVMTIAAITITVLPPIAESAPRRRAPAPIFGSPPVGAGVGISGGSGGVRVGGSVGGSADPMLNSAATGAALGSLGGPIGMAIGAGVGLLHGLWAKKKHEQEARAEAERQRAMDRELERQMATQRPGGGALPEGEGQGVLIVKDHLADAPSASPATPDPGTRVASVPAPRESAAPKPPPREPATRDQRDQVDAEGFRAVYERDRLVRREHRAPDGSVDVVLHYDEHGRVVRRDESTRFDGRRDTSSFYRDGALQRKESDTDGDGKPDVWAYYDNAGELSRLESLVAGGGRRTEVYRAGRVVERREGDLVSVFDEAGRLARQGRTGAGERLLAWRHFEPNGNVLRDEEFGEDGRLSAVSHYEGGRLVRRDLYEIDESAFTRVPLVSAGAAGR